MHRTQIDMNVKSDTSVVWRARDSRDVNLASLMVIGNERELILDGDGVAGEFVGCHDHAIGCRPHVYRGARDIVDRGRLERDVPFEEDRA